MAELPWSNAVEIIQPHVVRISTPRGSGSGFLISNGHNNAVCGIATAAHVVDHAHYWEEPIRIDHVSSGKSLVIRRDDRAIFLDLNRDTAALLFNRGVRFLQTRCPWGSQRHVSQGGQRDWLARLSCNSQQQLEPARSDRQRRGSVAALGDTGALGG